MKQQRLRGRDKLRRDFLVGYLNWQGGYGESDLSLYFGISESMVRRILESTDGKRLRVLLSQTIRKRDDYEGQLYHAQSVWMHEISGRKSGPDES